MSAFPIIRSAAVPLPLANIDTDIIFPARFLLITDRDGLGRYGFYDWRFDAQGQPRDDFPMAREPWASARILVGGDNFGCGSSREQAAWALAAMGIRCVIAPGFGEIFEGNCFKNGILPLALGPDDHAALLADAQVGARMEIDLGANVIRREAGADIGFSINPARREALLNGWDDIDQIVANHASAIDAFEARQRDSQPWLWHGDRMREMKGNG